MKKVDSKEEDLKKEIEMKIEIDLNNKIIILSKGNNKKYKWLNYREEFKIKKIEKGIIFAGHTFLGNRMDGWSNHKHYIAIKDGLIISEMEREDGWNTYACMQKRYSDWKKEVLEI